VNRSVQPDLFSQSPATPEAAEEHPVLTRLRDLNPDELSARQALELIYSLKHELDQ